ncbi:MAG: hypothetical protein ACTH2Q_05040 [Propionibacteriaceae bacterium]
MTALIDPVDNWHMPTPSVMLDMSTLIEQTLGPFSSVSGVLGWACQQVFGKDPVAWVKDHFDGDWKSVSAAGDCLTQMGDWMETMSSNAETHAWSFSMNWTGEAALAARGQFLELSKALSPAPAMIRECGRATEWVATEIFAQATVVSAMVESVVAGLAAIVSPAALAAAIPKAISTILRVLGFITKGLASIGTIVSGIQGQGDSLSALPKIAVTTGYDNPMVS